jgi:predicted dehydrogenase
VVKRLGMIGLSEGNGHPFSFSAIINGYDADAFARAGWPVILDYLKVQKPDAFGFPDMQVTHAWTQDRETTAKLCAACKIANGVEKFEDMLGQVDAVIVARDDWPTHLPFAKPFLDQGVPVFIDKPLSLDEKELDYFAPHLSAARLMSTSGLRYARELDAVRAELPSLGILRLVSGTVVNDLERYGIHMLDALSSVGLPPVKRVTRVAAGHDSYAVTLADGVLFLLNCLGAVGKTFHLSFFGTKGQRHVDLHDNFSAFRRTLAAFREMLLTGKPPIDPRQVLDSMRMVAAAKKLAPGESWEARPA